MNTPEGAGRRLGAPDPAAALVGPGGRVEAVDAMSAARRDEGTGPPWVTEGGEAMEFRTLLFRIAPQPNVEAEDFEVALRTDVMPAVDTGQTRAGRIVEARVYRTAAGQYRLLVDVETMTGSSWALDRLQAALDELEQIGIVDTPVDMVRVATTAEAGPATGS